MTDNKQVDKELEKKRRKMGNRQGEGREGRCREGEWKQIPAQPIAEYSVLSIGRWVLKWLQLCPILTPWTCSRPGPSVHGILQARILEWVANPFSRESSWLRDWTWVSCTAGGFFTSEPQGKPGIQKQRKTFPPCPLLPASRRWKRQGSILA